MNSNPLSFDKMEKETKSEQTSNDFGFEAFEISVKSIFNFVREIKINCSLDSILFQVKKLYQTQDAREEVPYLESLLIVKQLKALQKLINELPLQDSNNFPNEFKNADIYTLSKTKPEWFFKLVDTIYGLFKSQSTISKSEKDSKEIAQIRAPLLGSIGNILSALKKVLTIKNDKSNWLCFYYLTTFQPSSSSVPVLMDMSKVGDLNLGKALWLLGYLEFLRELDLSSITEIEVYEQIFEKAISAVQYSQEDIHQKMAGIVLATVMYEVAVRNIELEIIDPKDFSEIPLNTTIISSLSFTDKEKNKKTVQEYWSPVIRDAIQILETDARTQITDFLQKPENKPSTLYNTSSSLWKNLEKTESLIAQLNKVESFKEMVEVIDNFSKKVSIPITTIKKIIKDTQMRINNLEMLINDEPPLQAIENIEIDSDSSDDADNAFNKEEESNSSGPEL